MIPACPTGKTLGATGGMVRQRETAHFNLLWVTSSGCTSNLINWTMFCKVSWNCLYLFHVITNNNEADHRCPNHDAVL